MDSKETLWIMLGDLFYVTQGTYYRLYNVWNYDPKADKYRYVWGNNDTARVPPETYGPRNPGDLRVPAETNHPGPILFGGATIDNNDNIWFMTGDVFTGEWWMFNTTSMLFTRVTGTAGDDEPNMGTPGQPGEDVQPGYSTGACVVTDSQGDVWLLAGQGYSGYVDAVWHFNTSSWLWTFIAGSIQEQVDRQNSTYYGGTWMPGCFIDANDRIWLFGGYNSDDYGSLWTFDTRVKREWELEWGDDTYRALPQSVSTDFNADNHPGAAEGCLLIDRMDGTLMLFPGVGYTSDENWGALDQVWLYSKSLKQWKLVHGSISVYDKEGSFINYRQPGSTLPAAFMYTGRFNGKNQNGDMYIVGGSIYNGPEIPGRKDIWLIPNDQCSIPSLNKCDVNADCIEEMIGYSCVCKQGYTGDGFTCDAIPPVAPVAVPVATPGASVTTPSKKTSGGVVVCISLVAVIVSLLAL